MERKDTILGSQSSLLVCGFEYPEVSLYIVYSMIQYVTSLLQFYIDGYV